MLQDKNREGMYSRESGGRRRIERGLKGQMHRAIGMDQTKTVQPHQRSRKGNRGKVAANMSIPSRVFATLYGWKVELAQGPQRRKMCFPKSKRSSRTETDYTGLQRNTGTQKRARLKLLGTRTSVFTERRSSFNEAGAESSFEEEQESVWLLFQNLLP